MHALTLSLTSGQVLHVNMSEPAQARLLTAIVLEKTRLQVEADTLMRTFHLGEEPTKGLDYDDRLTVRLKCSVKTAYAHLGLSVKKGGLRHTRHGRNYVVTELACRQFLGDSQAVEAAAQTA